MRPRNLLFAQAIDYLYKTGRVKDQKELAQITGINEVTISRILNDRVKQPSEETLRKFDAAFGGLFNMAYFRGESELMLANFATVPAASAAVPPPPSPSPAPTPQDALIAELRQHIEELRQRIADKEEIIRAKDALILELRRNYSTCYRLDMVAENK